MKKSFFAAVAIGLSSVSQFTYACDKPVVTAFSDNDPVSKGGDVPIQARIPGARGQPHVTLSGGHFLQEDCPNDIVEILDALIARS